MNNNIAKRLIFETVIKLAINKAIQAAPILGYSVINPIFVFIAQKLYSFLYDVIEEGTTLLIIDIKTERQKEQYEEATTELATAIKEGQSNEDIKKAHEEFKRKLEALIRLNPPK